MKIGLISIVARLFGLTVYVTERRAVPLQGICCGCYVTGFLLNQSFVPAMALT
jgi:hypothetical protein